MNELGKIPPQAIDMEMAVIGAVMLEKSAIDEIIELIRPEVFYKDSHKSIWTAILSLYQQHEPIDILTVTEKLRAFKKLDEIGGTFYLSTLTQSVASSANIIYHAQIIVEKFIGREVIRICSTAIQNAFDDSCDISDVLDQISNDHTKITQSITSDNITRIRDAVSENMDTLSKIASGHIKLTGIPTGKTKLDRVTSGWQNSDLVIIAARPSMGKSSLALDFAFEAANIAMKPTVLFSLEMPVSQLSLRLISGESGLTQADLRSGKIGNWDQLEKDIQVFDNLPLYIDDTPALKITEFRARLKLYIQRYGIELVFIDYLQLMDGGNRGNREQEVSQISKGIKACAKEYNIPIIALSQLSRRVEERTDKRPMLSDLRESGSIEQDSDIVMFIYKPERYGIEFLEDNTPTTNMTQLIVAKHRNGPLADLFLWHNDSMTKFYNDKNETATINPNTEFGNEKPF